MSNSEAQKAIRESVDRETRAWDTQDLDLLLSIFHPDMVWPWPPSPKHHDPISWVLEQGRFDRDRWRKGWEDLFITHELVCNMPKTLRIAVSEQGDGAFAVVDVDTLWRDAQGRDFHLVGPCVQNVQPVRGQVENDGSHGPSGL